MLTAVGENPNVWGLTPLGEAGELKLPDGFANAPVFRPRAPFEPGLVLCDKDVTCAVVAPKGNRKLVLLADEFAWHLGRMCGREVAVTDVEPAGDVPRVVFEEIANQTDVSNVRTEDRRLVVSGSGTGVSHALTYVLESLGCRYLWPGTSGKVVPRRDRVVLPKDIDITFTPKLVLRGVRSFTTLLDRTTYSLRRLGLDPRAFKDRQNRACRDRTGNRGFWQWHGVNDSRDVAGYSATPGRYEWGHYFGDYIEHYAKDHLEWFALQCDGSREMRWEKERPTFCLSNKDLAEETVRNLIAKFKAHPDKVAVSACLPDGGHAAQCMCEACRRLDPVNAPPASFTYFNPKRTTVPYVSLTDRVLTFANRLAEGVDAALPGKRLTFYCYCNYEQPPVRVKPHRSLIFFNVTGDYSTLARRPLSQKSMAAWSAFGNELFWRPNALRCFNVSVPQDISRQVFTDFELFKANHLIGTDFDCMDNQWANKGLAYYMVAKAHINAEQLSYDDLLDDYCRTGFGAAADDVKAYFAFLASETDRVAAANGETVILADGREVGSGAMAYVRTFDVERAASLLDCAVSKVADDADVLRRIRFLKWGVEGARHERLCATTSPRDPALKERQKAFFDFFQKAAADDDGLVAVNPEWEGFYNSRIRGALITLPKK